MPSLILGTIAMFVLGFGVWFATPFVAHMLPNRVSEKAMRARSKTAMGFFGRCLLIERDGGKPLLKRSVLPDMVKGEAATVNGDTEVWFDPDSTMSLWHGKPFGITHIDTSVIFDPVLTYAGKRVREKAQRGRFEAAAGKVLMYLGLSADETPVTTPSDGRTIQQGSAPPKAVETIETYIEKAQSGWNTTAVLDYMQLLISLGGGVGIGWGMLKLLSSLGGGGGGTTIPLWVGVLPL